MARDNHCILSSRPEESQPQKYNYPRLFNLKEIVSLKSPLIISLNNIKINKNLALYE